MSSFGDVTYQTAKNTCINDSGDAFLAEPKSEEENRALSVLAGGRAIWIGIHDEITEGTFVYDTDKKEIKYSNWDINEPNDQHGDEDYTILVSYTVLLIDAL